MVTTELAAQADTKVARDAALADSAKWALEDIAELQDVLAELQARLATRTLTDADRAELAEATTNLMDGLRFTLAVAAW